LGLGIVLRPGHRGTRRRYDVRIAQPHGDQAVAQQVASLRSFYEPSQRRRGISAAHTQSGLFCLHLQTVLSQRHHILAVTENAGDQFRGSNAPIAVKLGVLQQPCRSGHAACNTSDCRM